MFDYSFAMSPMRSGVVEYVSKQYKIKNHSSIDITSADFLRITVLLDVSEIKRSLTIVAVYRLHSCVYFWNKSMIV